MIDIPEPVEHLWDWFWELDSVRGSNGFGPNPLTYSEIRAWSQLTETEITPWEVSVLKKMDVIRISTTMSKR